MKVVVCVKQVPDTKGGVKFNPDGTLDRAAMLTIMNPDDKAGLEAALRLKDQYGAEVTVVTMGLPKAEEVLREAMAMGADKGILVTDRFLAERIHGLLHRHLQAHSGTLTMTLLSQDVRRLTEIRHRLDHRFQSILEFLLFLMHRRLRLRETVWLLSASMMTDITY